MQFVKTCCKPRDKHTHTHTLTIHTCGRQNAKLEQAGANVYNKLLEWEMKSSVTINKATRHHDASQDIFHVSQKWIVVVVVAASAAATTAAAAVYYVVPFWGKLTATKVGCLLGRWNSRNMLISDLLASCGL